MYDIIAQSNVATQNAMFWGFTPLERPIKVIVFVCENVSR